MPPFGTIRNIQLVVWVVILIIACYVIIVVEASPEHNSPGVSNQTINEANVRTESGDSRIRKDDNLTEEQTNELQELIRGIFYTAFFIFKFIFTSIFSIIYQVLRPIIYLINQVYYTFFVVPFGFIKLAFITVYPVFTFLTVAALLGLCFGGTAGWISEVIVGVLTTPVNDEPITNEIENKKRVAKIKKRAAALANLKARNGGKIPEEFYGRFAANGRPGVTRKGSNMSSMIEGYDKGEYENSYKGYSSAGLGD
ncbi:14358_t:CDS:1 [Cetraspora pellucida]|uniref:14358_t:CDS:1 n=1 Tax=Cetraspora pellucida TaxID=1433469 RepID=A0A9N9HYF6_9GLOM|nr:14358_t:CDS:1 [Cetraspora pellucida]